MSQVYLLDKTRNLSTSSRRDRRHKDQIEYSLDILDVHLMRLMHD